MASNLDIVELNDEQVDLVGGGNVETYVKGVLTGMLVAVAFVIVATL